MNTIQSVQSADRHLIEAAAKGDADAFRVIVERHQAMVFRTCLRILRNEVNAEEAVQATFILLHQKCRKLHPATVLGGWLYRTAELVCREFIRSSQRRKGREEEAASVNETTVPDHTQTWLTLQPELDLAMKSLPQKYLDVVVLRYFEGKSTNETATDMGLSASAVTTRLARAIEQLRAWFQRRGIVLSTASLSVALAENANAGTIPTGLAPAILGVTGTLGETAAISANTTLMVKGAVAKLGSIVWLLFEAILFIVWIDSMFSWIRRGCPIPRWVHILAVILSGSGLVLAVTLRMMGILTLELATSCIAIPPVATYISWLWLFGPEHAMEPQENHTEL